MGTEAKVVEKKDPFDITEVGRRDLCVVTYRCPEGHTFDKFVARENLELVGTVSCITHPDKTASIHESRSVR